MIGNTTVAQAKWVSGQVEFSRPARKSFLVASQGSRPLLPVQQDALLDAAVDHLRQLLKLVGFSGADGAMREAGDAEQNS